MSRPLRLQFPGALYHVTTRGNTKQNIFLDDADRRVFLALLGTCVKRCDWTLPAYVLMTNHFHLVLQLTCETLSLGFQWLHGEYAKYFNRRHGFAGHVLQSRPDAPLIEKESYYLNVLRYAVLNPVRAKMVARPEDYEWSSHRAVLGRAPVPDWLAVDDVLAQFGPTREIARERYSAFVDAGIGLDDNPWKHLKGQIYLGTEDWYKKMREKVDLKPRADDHPRVQRHIGAIPMVDIVAAVAKTLSIDFADVRRHRIPRLVAAWLGWNEALLTNREIAAGLRLRSSGYVSTLVRQSEREVVKDPALQIWVEQCLSTLRGR